jgi:hypothetical protein
MLTKSQNLSQNSHFVIDRCFVVPTSYWLKGICTRNKLSQGFQNHRWFPVIIFSVKIADLGSLKWVTGGIFKISKQFQRSKLKL